VEPDQETYDRVLKEQLDQGIDRRVAEGRAKAAGIRAARAGGATTEPVAPEPATKEAPAAETAPTDEGAGPAAEIPETEAKAEAEASARAQTPETTKEPEVVEQPPPEREQAGEEPAKVRAPEPAEKAPEPADQPKPPAPAGADQETFDQVLEEQLGKGLPRPIAEGRARAAAIKAAREKAGA
jgi:hypothetical protein